MSDPTPQPEPDSPVVCDCGAVGDGPHSITCATVAATVPYAMVDDAGQVFYPDSPIDAAAFAALHGARFLDPIAGAEWLTEAADDPAPTTGAPEEYHFPEGCVCHIRDDIDWGEVYVHPPGGCPVHTPWAFPGYSLTTIAADGYL
jgi:hypothetical protein